MNKKLFHLLALFFGIILIGMLVQEAHAVWTGVQVNSTSTPTVYTIPGALIITGTSTSDYVQVPVAAAPTPSTSGTVAYDLNHNGLVEGDGNYQNSFIPRMDIVTSTVNDTINSAQASNSIALYKTSSTIPANFLIQNKLLAIYPTFTFAQTSSNGGAVTFYMWLSSSTATGTPQYQSMSATQNTTHADTYTPEILVYANTGPGANASVTVSVVGPGNNTGASALSPFSINQATATQAISTNASLHIYFGALYANNSNTMTSTLLSEWAQEMN